VIGDIGSALNYWKENHGCELTQLLVFLSTGDADKLKYTSDVSRETGIGLSGITHTFQRLGPITYKYEMCGKKQIGSGLVFKTPCKRVRNKKLVDLTKAGDKFYFDMSDSIIEDNSGLYGDISKACFYWFSKIGGGFNSFIAFVFIGAAKGAGIERIQLCLKSKTSTQILSTTLAKLVERGLIKSEPRPDSPNTSILKLTSKGRGFYFKLSEYCKAEEI